MSDAAFALSNPQLDDSNPAAHPGGLSNHLRSCASRFGLSTVAERLARGEQLTPEEALVLPQAPLFLLSALVHLVVAVRRSQKSRLRPVDFVPTVHPVFLLSLAEWIEAGGEKTALEQAEAAVRQVDRELRLTSPLWLALDRWHGTFERATLFRTANATLEVGGLFHPIRFVGPSTVELQGMFTAEQSAQLAHTGQPATTEPRRIPKPTTNESEWFARLFQELKSHRLTAIDGGTDFDLHALAAARNMTVTVGHDISSFIEAAVYAPVAADYQEENFFRVIEERFIQELLDVQNRIGGTGYMRTWFPWFRSALRKFHRTSDQAFGAPLLRMLAFARLVLADATYVRAPLSLFGKHFVQCAHLFGANDVGYAAIDTRTADALGIPRLSDVAPLIGVERLYPEITT